MLNKIRNNWGALILTILMCVVGHFILHSDRYNFLKDDNYYAVVAKASYEVKHNILVSNDSTIRSSDTCRYLVYHYEGTTLMSNSIEKATFDKTNVGDILIVRTTNYITYVLCMVFVIIVLMLAMVLNFKMS